MVDLGLTLASEQLRRTAQEEIRRSSRQGRERVEVNLQSRKRAARAPKILSKKAEKLRGIKAKIFNKKRFVEKVNIKKA
jgi:ribosome biogenesis protein NSA2